ncbi:hypothetical protein KR222_001786 [Zaprionus bogoriensis]|nr:hypothetical protein KR222_001786 [Zaprionus bogoriensis]
MADGSGFKLFRTVDPSTVNVQIKEKFAKLTLSSNKKKEEHKAKALDTQRSKSKASRQLLDELSKSNISPESQSRAMGVEQTPKTSRDDRSQLDASDYMETLQLSADGCTQQTDTDVDLDVEGLSTQVSNLTMQAKQPELSICISSTTEEAESNESDAESCITISDTSVSESEQEPPAPSARQAGAEAEAQPQQDATMAVSEQLDLPVPPLSHDKVQRIEAFLRDVSFERHEMIRRGYADETGELRHSRLESADTESMSPDGDSTHMTTTSPPCTPSRIASKDLDSSKRLADNETEVNTQCSSLPAEQDSSRRLADNETEVNTLCSAEQDSSRRLADNETEVNTLCSSELAEQDSSRRLANNETEANTPDLEATLSEADANESVVIPETSCETEAELEVEPSPARPSSASSNDVQCTPLVQVSSINISAKINIKINIPHLDSSSAESDAPDADETRCDTPQSAGSPHEAGEENVDVAQQPEQQQRQQQGNNSVLLTEQAAPEDQGFLSNAEKLLNELYGKSWQTPDIIRTLTRTGSKSGRAKPAARYAAPATPTAREEQAASTFRTPLTEVRRQPKTRTTAATTAKKRAPLSRSNESAIGDFSLFKRALHANKLNSTQLPTAARTEKGPSRHRVRTNHVDEDRWRALIDSESGTDASDDEDADATNASDSGSSGHANDGNDITYLDLTKAQIEVVDSPDAKENRQLKSPPFPKRLEDILRTCRAKDKPKLIATPKTPDTFVTPKATEKPTRRQLFVPNTGYEDENAAKRIVDEALEMGTLDDLEVVYTPGSTVHKRLQEVKRQLGIAVISPKSKPIFPLQTPRTPKERTKKAAPERPTAGQERGGVCSFLKSLDAAVERKYCNSEAYEFRQNFAKTKEALTKRLYDMYNQEVFNNKLDVPIVWSKRLRNTAGRCMNKRRMQVRCSVVELSEKVLTSADRLRCTLIHELCHAATWVFNGEGGHGHVWKNWARRACMKFPDLPPISVCHNYDIQFKYTYKCTACGLASHAHSKSRKPENLRCSSCRGSIVLLLNKKDKSGNVVPTPVREATGFAKFVKENYQKYKRDNLTAPQVMRILSSEYAKLRGKAEPSEAKQAEISRLLDQVETLNLDEYDDN